MSSIILTLYSGKNLGKKDEAINFFKIMENYNMVPDKIGLYEPLKDNYTLDKAVDMWIKNEGDNIFQGGSIIGKKKEPNLRFDVSWYIGKKARPNNITLWFTKKSFKQYRKNIENIFKNLIIFSDSFYGYITLFDVEQRQHVTGTIETRIPGVFWCNYFGKTLIDFFGKDKLLNTPWVQYNILKNNGLITYLADEIDKDLLVSDELELKLKKYLGSDSFGDPKEFYENPDKVQIKKVPEFDLSEIRTN